MAGKPKAKTRWGWIAFGAGLAICVVAGGVLGVILGKNDSGGDVSDVQRVAALALDTSRLNDDALGLSRAIEEAIARDELESEAEMFSAELARLQARAGLIRVRVESQGGADRGAEPVREATAPAARRARRGLREIDATLAVFEQEVVARLNSVLSSPSPSGPSTGEAPEPASEALADATLVLEEQDRTLTDLTNDLIEVDQATETSASPDPAEQESADLVSGSFESTLVQGGGYTLDIEYELQDFDAEVETVSAEPGKTSVAMLASGELTVTNTTPERGIGLELPSFDVVMYWKDSDVPSAAGEATFEDDTPCRYELSGELYCALARLAFEQLEPSPDASGGAIPEPGEVALKSDGMASVDALESGASLLVEQQDTDLVADFIGASPPDLVQVVGASFEEDLRPACAIPSTPGEDEESEYPEAAGITLGLLSAEGAVIFEAAEADQPLSTDAAGVPQVPECFTLLDE